MRTLQAASIHHAENELSGSSLAVGTSIIEVDSLEKSYGPTHALRGVSFRLEPGERVTLLGPNGSGKTTALEIVGGFLQPSSGRVRVLGVESTRLSPRERQYMGFVFQEKPGLYPELTVRETLELFSGYYPNPIPPAQLLAQLGLEGKQTRRVQHLSGGERRRLELAVALIGRPRLVFLDEPTASLDPEARQRIWGLLEGLAQTGTTFILTTHSLEEAERLGQRVLLLKEGKLLFDGPPQAMIARSGLPHRISFKKTVAHLPSGLASRAVAEGERLVLKSLRPEDDLMILRESGLELADLRVQSPTLEEAYLALLRGGVRV
ncbi:ABC transporter ATP-binding protein [Meiothermus sp. CFH 77666]|uniref:ATP-binding cassette domain-containing protein n=1 Tax=Meiothermus sp. CFH 77666 TaxID=2817942 RepID=UPI001AA0872D|nr:ABC transporter ATP-binding protein [Meiothermus sp. CFH 77666]